MKKFLVGLFTSVLAILLSLNLVASAEEEFPYPWLEEYEEDGAYVFWPRGNKEFSDGYAGIDFIIRGTEANDSEDDVWVLTLSRASNIIQSPGSVTGTGAPSFFAYIENISDEDWKYDLEVEGTTAYTFMYIDENDVIYKIETDIVMFNIPELEGIRHNIEWDYDNEKINLVNNTLTYEELDSDFANGLTKEEVDNNSEGVTWADDDFIFKHGETGQYSNEKGEGYAPVYRTIPEFTLPAGHKMISFKWLERSNHLEALQGLWRAVGGTFEKVSHDVTFPEFHGLPSQEVVRHQYDQEFTFPKVTATDVNADGEIIDLTSEIVREIYKYNPETNKFDIKIDNEEDVDTTEVGARYQFNYTVSDGINVTKASFILEILSRPSPKIIGVADITINVGDPMPDLTAGIIAQDGYGNDITHDIKVIHNVNPDKAGEYLVIYTVQNAYNDMLVEYAYVRVQDDQPPYIYPTDPIVVEKGAEITQNDIIARLVITDNNDSRDQLQINILSSDWRNFDVDEAGEYKLTVIATDMAGNNFQRVITVVVQDPAETIDSKLEDVKDNLDELNKKVSDVNDELDKEAKNLTDKLNKEVTDLEKQVNDLEKQLKSKDNLLLVLTIISGVVALGSVALAVYGFKRK